MFNSVSSIADWQRLSLSPEHQQLRLVSLAACGLNSTSCLPWLPPSVVELNLFGNPIASMKQADLPSTVVHLKIQLDLTEPLNTFEFPETLQCIELQVSCRDGTPIDTQLCRLQLPQQLRTLIIQNNGLTSLKNLQLPAKLQCLDISGNRIFSRDMLPRLSSSLKQIKLSNNPMPAWEIAATQDEIVFKHTRYQCLLQLCRVSLPMSSVATKTRQTMSRLRLFLMSLTSFVHIRETILRYWRPVSF